MIEGKNLANKIAQLASDKKAHDVLLLDMQQLTPMTDFYVIASASNDTQVRAIADNIEDTLRDEESVPVLHKEGYSAGRWILLDYGSVVAHVFLESEREFYNLEQLWADAPSEEFVEK